MKITNFQACPCCNGAALPRETNLLYTVEGHIECKGCGLRSASFSTSITEDSHTKWKELETKWNKREGWRP